jgi:hypothetical protein
MSNDWIKLYGKVDASQAQVIIKHLNPRIMKALTEEMKRQSNKLNTYVKQKILTGGTASEKLAVRTGNLRRSTVPMIPVVKEDNIRGGVQFGAKYAVTHFGNEGEIHTITPKKSKFLAIPIGEALTGAGVPRYASPRDVPGLQLINRKGKPSLLALVKIKGRIEKATGAMKIKGASGSLIPMFILMKSVKVKARIHPKSIIRDNIEGINKAFKTAIIGACKSNG